MTLGLGRWLLIALLRGRRLLRRYGRLLPRWLHGLLLHRWWCGLPVLWWRLHGCLLRRSVLVVAGCLVLPLVLLWLIVAIARVLITAPLLA